MFPDFFKKSIAAVLCLCCFNIAAQDVLYFKDGSVKKAKIFSLMDEEIVWGYFNPVNMSTDSINTASFTAMDSILLENGKKMRLNLLSMAHRKIKNPEMQRNRELQEAEYDEYRNNFQRPGIAGVNLPVFDALIYFRNKDTLNARVYDISNTHVYWCLTDDANSMNPLRYCQRWQIDSIFFRCGDKRYFYNEHKPLPVDSVRNQSGMLVYLYEEDLLTDMGQRPNMPDLIESFEDGKEDAHAIVSPPKRRNAEVASFFGGMFLVGFPIPMIASKKLGFAEGYSLAHNKIRYLKDPGYSEGFRTAAGQVKGTRPTVSYFSGLLTTVLLGILILAL